MRTLTMALLPHHGLPDEAQRALRRLAWTAALGTLAALVEGASARVQGSDLADLVVGFLAVLLVLCVILLNAPALAAESVPARTTGPSRPERTRPVVARLLHPTPEPRPPVVARGLVPWRHRFRRCGADAAR